MAGAPRTRLSHALIPAFVLAMVSLTAPQASGLHQDNFNQFPENIWQTNGQVRNIAQYKDGTHDLIFLAGKFTEIRPCTVKDSSCDGQAIPVTNLAVLDGYTGAPPSGDLAGLEAALPRVGVAGSSDIVYSLAVSGNELIIGGSFSYLNGTIFRKNIAAIDPLTGTVLGPSTIPAWVDSNNKNRPPNINGTVWGLAANDTMIFAGGTFSKVDGNGAYKLMAKFSSGGTLDTRWVPPTFVCNFCPTIGHNQVVRVRSIAFANSPTAIPGVFVTGDFDEIDNGGVNDVTPSAYHTLAELDLTTGNLTAWRMEPFAAGTDAFGIDLATDGPNDRLYVAEGGSDFITAYSQTNDMNTGQAQRFWLTDVNGSAQAIIRVGTSDLLVGGHFIYAALGPGDHCPVRSTPDPYPCVKQLRLAAYHTDGTLDWSGDARSGHPCWYAPVTGNYWGTWDLFLDTTQSNGQHIYIGGQFFNVGGVPVSYFSRFNQASPPTCT